MSYFIFNDIKSEDLKIIVNKLPAREIPAERKELIEVAGRDGYLTFRENSYAPITLQIECTARNDVDIYAMANILKGSGKLILSTDTEKYYEAEVINSIPFERILGMWKRFVIHFQCQPYLKSKTIINKPLIVGNNTLTIQGTGKVYPLLEIIGNGTFKININNKTIKLIDINPNIKIDNELMNATSIDGLQNLNNKLEGEFFTFKNGENTVLIEMVSGTLTTAVLKYQEAWL